MDNYGDPNTWREMLTILMADKGETFDDVEGVGLPEGGSLDTEFNTGFGSPEGCEFTVWTKKHVYFPVCYDGAESVGVVRRNPNGLPTKHVGGY